MGLALKLSLPTIVTMSPNQAAVANAITVLLSTTPDTNLGQLLKVCLAARVSEGAAAKSWQLLAAPENLAGWLQEIVADDNSYTPEEWSALGEMTFDSAETFATALVAEVEALPL